ncbi:MAG: T9SS type A sorting domain-containing protein [Bacteroidetes bacterium]|nr:T9SS type A sorting domain-containing protein [Bacteroidota bacterium]
MKRLLLSALLFTATCNLTKAQSLNFDGIDDYVSVNSILLPSANNVTMEGWFRPEASGNYQELMYNGNYNSCGYGLFLMYGYIHLTSTGYNDYSTNVYLPYDTWSHIALTIDANNVWKLYVNGQLAETRTITTIIPNNGVTSIGNDGTIGGGTYYHGSADEVRFWSTERTQSQIQQGMYCNFNYPQSNLVAYYNFNQGTPNANNAGITTLNDLSGNNYNATLNNFALNLTSSNWVNDVNNQNPIAGALVTSDFGNICTGQLVTFSATPTAGGSAPSYQWYKNNQPVGTNASTYLDSTLVNGDTITCMLASSYSCATNAISNKVSIPVNTPSLVAQSSIYGYNQSTGGSSSTTQVSAYAGQQIQFGQNWTNGGNNPAFQWKINGTNAGTNPYFSTSSLNNLDTVSCLIHSSDACVSKDSISNKIIVHITALPPNSIPYDYNNSCYTFGNVQYCAPWYYDYGNRYYDPIHGISGDAMDDATILSTGQGDAYDGAFEVAVNDTAYSNAPDNLISFDTLTNTMRGEPQQINGLDVTKELHFYLNKPIVRLNVKLENPTGSPIQVRVAVSSNLGSDNQTQLDSNSTATGTLSNADRWMITSDGQVHSDPINTWVRRGAGPLQSQPGFYHDKPEMGDDDYEDSLNVTIPAHSYVNVVQFNRVDSTVQAAKNFVSYFNHLPTMINDNLFEGISDLSKIVNWNIPVPAASFSTTALNGCDSLPVHFTNTSLNSDSLSWNFGDGSPVSIASNPSHTFYTGTYTITLTTYNHNSGIQSTSTVTAQVHVLPAVVAVSSNTALCAGQSATLTASGASTYTWSTTQTTPSIVISPTTTVNYTVTGTDANGCVNTATCQQAVVPCTGIQELPDNTPAVNLYPNPNNGSFILEITTDASICITNTLGQVLYSAKTEAGKHTINIEHEHAGVYYVHILENNKQHTVKLIKE